MSKQRCKHCSYEWDYKGRYIHKATCPDCKTNTPIKRTPKELEEIKVFKQLQKQLEEKKAEMNSAEERVGGVNG